MRVDRCVALVLVAVYVRLYCVCGVVRKRTYHASYRTVGRYIWRLGRDSGDKKDVSLLGVVVSNITQQYPYE